jgi:hypothetical protein
MTEQLSQIQLKLPDSGLNTYQLHMLFKAIDGQSVTAYLTYRNNQLLIELPLTLTKAHDSANSNSRNVALQTQTMVDDLQLASRIQDLKTPILLKITPQMQHNRVALQINDTTDGVFKLNSLPSSALKTLLSELTPLLAQPKPIVSYQLTALAISESGNTNTLIKANVFLAATTPIAMPNLISQSVHKHLATADESTNRKSSLTQANEAAGNIKISQPNNGVLIQQLMQKNSQSVSNTDYGFTQLSQSAIPTQATKTPIDIYQQQGLDKSYRTPARELALTHFKQIIENDLSRQKPLHQILANLRQRLPTLAQPLGISKPQLQSFLDTLNSLPKAQQLTSNSLHELLQNSGVFREYKIMTGLKQWLLANNPSHTRGIKPTVTMPNATSTPMLPPNTHLNVLMQPTLIPLEGDIKHLLAKLHNLITQNSNLLLTENTKGASIIQGVLTGLKSRLPIQKQDASNTRVNQLFKLLNDIESGLSRTRILQHINLPQDTNATQPWIFELPLIHGKEYTSVQLKLEQEQTKNSKTSGKTWRVTIRFEFESLGAFSALAELRAQEIKVRFFAERPETLSLLEQKISTLEASLQESGLTVNRAPSAIQPVPSLIEPKLGDQLLDITI